MPCITPISRPIYRAVVAVYVAAGISLDKMIPMIAPVTRAFEETYGGRQSREVLETTVRELVLEIESEEREEAMRQTAVRSIPGCLGPVKRQPAPPVAPAARRRKTTSTAA